MLESSTGNIVLLLMSGIIALPALVSSGTRVFGRNQTAAEYAEQQLEWRSRLVMALLFGLGLAFGGFFQWLFVGLVSFILLRDYYSSISIRQTDRNLIFFSYFLIPAQLFLLAYNEHPLSFLLLPIIILVVVPLIMFATTPWKGFLRSMLSIQWGVLLAVYALCLIAFMVVVPLNIPPVVAAAALLVYMAFSTQVNDLFTKYG